MPIHAPRADCYRDRMRTVLLTGATTGIGLAVARRLLARPEYRVILTARESSLARFAELGIVENERVLLRPLDVTDPRQRIEQMAINFLGPMDLARRVLPAMRAQRWGRIVNVSSVGGMMAMPTMSIYSASKFALEGATESLFYEVKPFGVRVSLVEPGFINSGSFRNTRYTRESRESESDMLDPYYPHYHFMSKFIEWLMTHARATPDSVARRIVRTVTRRRPPLRVAGTFDAHIFDLMRRLLPRRLYHFILYRTLPGVRKWGVFPDA